MGLLGPIIFFLIFVVCKFRYALTLNNVDLNTITDSKSADSTLCTEAKCIMKCCPLEKYITPVQIMKKKWKRTCVYYNTTRDFTSLAKDVFIEYPETSKLNFTVKDGIFEANETFKEQSFDVTSWFNVYLTEYPEVYLEFPNAYERWTRIPNNRFCWDYKITRLRKGVNPGIWVVYTEHPDEPLKGHGQQTTDIEEIEESELMRLFRKITKKSTTIVKAMLVSCVFLLIVLVVCALLPELQDLYGQIIMAYVSSLFATFLLFAIMRIKMHTDWTCRGFSFVIYFCNIASFCWLHVMSYDIWWTFRSYAKARPIHQRNETFKFLLYCLYAFGLPLIMSITLADLNEMDMSHIPWFIKPHIPINGCFLEGGEKLLYLDIPLLILILCNCIFYLMTAFHVWRLNLGTAVLDPAAAGKHKKRFMIYLRLTAVMGLKCLLEIVSFKYPSFTMWFISDFYNILIGVNIFLIFVCKQKNLKKLMTRYSKFKTEW